MSPVLQCQCRNSKNQGPADMSPPCEGDGAWARGPENGATVEGPVVDLLTQDCATRNAHAVAVAADNAPTSSVLAPDRCLTLRAVAIESLEQKIDRRN
jgi:hypothetical protein